MSLFDQVHTMPLTPILFMSMLPHAPIQQQLCNVFAALRTGVKRLVKYYDDLVAPVPGRNDVALSRPDFFYKPLPFVLRPDNPLELPPPLAGCVLQNTVKGRILT